MEVDISVHGAMLSGFLEIPNGAKSLVIVCSDKDYQYGYRLNNLGIATLVVNLSTNKETLTTLNEEILTERLIGVTKWCVESENLKHMKFGYLGIGFGSQPTLSSSAYWGTKIKAMVVVGGRPDLAYEVLDLIESPTLLIAESDEEKVMVFLRTAYQKIGSVKKLEVVTSETKMVETTSLWFVKYLEGSLEKSVENGVAAN